MKRFLTHFFLFVNVILKLNYFCDNFELRALLLLKKFTSIFVVLVRHEERQRRVPQSAMLKSQINWPAPKKQPAGSQAVTQHTVGAHNHTDTHTQTQMHTHTRRQAGRHIHIHLVNAPLAHKLKAERESA